MNRKPYTVILYSRCVYNKLHLVLDTPIISFDEMLIPSGSKIIRLARCIYLITDFSYRSIRHDHLDNANLSIIFSYMVSFNINNKTITLKNYPYRRIK